MAASQNNRLFYGAICAELPTHPLRALFQPYCSIDRQGRETYSLTATQLDRVLEKIVDRLTGAPSEAEFSELVAALLQMRNLQSEQEKASTLLRRFRICQRDGKLDKVKVPLASI